MSVFAILLSDALTLLLSILLAVSPCCRHMTCLAMMACHAFATHFAAPPQNLAISALAGNMAAFPAVADSILAATSLEAGVELAVSWLVSHGLLREEHVCH
jgi:hypothetical protein